METSTKNVSTKDLIHIASVWSLLGFLIILIAFAFVSKFDFASQVQAFIDTYQGIPVASEVLSIWENISLILNLSLVMIVISLIVARFIPKGKSFNAESLSKIFQNGPSLFYAIIVFEELIARVLFLTIIGDWLLHAQYPLMIILLVIGNTAWAALHLANYKDPKDRKVLAVLPQFLGGLVLGYIYIRYGFLITLLVHLTFDFIILSSDKKQDNIAESVINSFYWLVVLIISTLVLNSYELNTLHSLGKWFTQSEIFTKPTENLWLMALMVVNFQATFNFITYFLVLDRTRPVVEGISKLTFFQSLIVYTLAGSIATMWILGLNWLAALVFPSIALRAVWIACTLTFLKDPKSGSGMANLWFTDIPVIFVYVFVVLNFGILESIFILTISYLFNHISEYFDE